MKVNLSMDDIRTKVEEYIKKAGRATGRPVLTAYYVMTADTTPDNERTNIMLALVAIVFPTSIEDVLPSLHSAQHLVQTDLSAMASSM